MLLLLLLPLLYDAARAVASIQSLHLGLERLSHYKSVRGFEW
jgi:hypothetical protein